MADVADGGAMDLLGPFPESHPELKLPGWFEHIVVTSVKAFVYTPLPFDDPRVQDVLERYLRTAIEAGVAESEAITPHSAFAAVRLAESVHRAREARAARPPRSGDFEEREPGVR